jgi:protease I
MFVEDNYEDLELWYPKIRLEEEGAEVVIAGPVKGKTYKGKNGYPCQSTAAIDQLHSDSFDGVVISGGFAPDRIRRDKKALQLTKEIMQAGKLVAHICHGGWVPISAGIMNGFKCTSTPAIRDDLTNAGADWIDQPVVVDRNMISSRRPDDLPAYMRAIIEFLTK